MSEVKQYLKYNSNEKKHYKVDDNGICPFLFNFNGVT